ncbi:MAG: N-acetyltransferase [Leptolyngbyaceae bacterium]|nr:N-acetyltransferase [Leptolyngbyaceae bacterium]
MSTDITLFKFWKNIQNSESETILETPSFFLRTASVNDAKELAALLTLSFHGDDPWMEIFHPILRFGIYEDLRSRIQSKTTRYACIIACQHDVGDRPHPRIMGTVELSVKRRSLSFFSSQYAYISNLATHPDYRRQGVAQHLLNGCEVVAQRWGFQDIYLHTLENNAPAQALYHKLGYQVERSEIGLSTWLLGQPKQLLLGKTLSVGSNQ